MDTGISVCVCVHSTPFLPLSSEANWSKERQVAAAAAAAAAAAK